LAATLDASGTKLQSATAQTSVNYTGLTVGASLVNSALVLALQFDANVSSITATWDNGASNQTMTRIGTGINIGAGRAELFGLVAPVSGNKTLRVPRRNELVAFSAKSVNHRAAYW
jgi:hypothetical protein